MSVSESKRQMDPKDTTALIPPQTYLFEWTDGGSTLACRSISIFALTDNRAKSSREASSQPSRSDSHDTNTTLISDRSPSFNPFRKGKTEEQSPQPLDAERGQQPLVKGAHGYCMKQRKRCSKHYALYTAKRGEDPESKLMDITQEACFGKPVSTYENCSTGQSVLMQKAKGKDGEPFWSCNRSFDDFDGSHYKIKTSIGYNYIIVRTSDGQEVARWKRVRCSFRTLGQLTVNVPLTPVQTHVLLCATFMKYDQDRRRRYKH